MCCIWSKTALKDKKCCSFFSAFAVNQSPPNKLASPRRKNAFESWKSPSDFISFTNLFVALSGARSKPQRAVKVIHYLLMLRALPFHRKDEIGHLQPVWFLLANRFSDSTLFSKLFRRGRARVFSWQGQGSRHLKGAFKSIARGIFFPSFGRLLPSGFYHTSFFLYFWKVHFPMSRVSVTSVSKQMTLPIPKLFFKNNFCFSRVRSKVKGP